MSVQAAVDIRADPMLYEACKDDSESLCKDVKHGGGRIQACLVRNPEPVLLLFVFPAPASYLQVCPSIIALVGRAYGCMGQELSTHDFYHGHVDQVFMQ